MTNLILTNCGFLVPPERVCWGTESHREEGVCDDCQIYAEKKTKPFYTKKATLTVKNGAVIKQHAFAISVEAVT